MSAAMEEVELMVKEDDAQICDVRDPSVASPAPHTHLVSTLLSLLLTFALLVL